MQSSKSLLRDKKYLLPPVSQHWRSDDWPLVSVSILTYNQVELIGRAIDSVLKQQVNFSYEIIIGDDFSNDGTREIIQAYQERHPGLISLICHPRKYEELAPGRINNITNIHSCRGKYTAFLDGDDYWLDPNKLLRQVNYLEANPTISAYWHNSRKSSQLEPEKFEDNEEEELLIKKNLRMDTGVYSQRYILEKTGRLSQLSSFMIRTRNYGELPENFYSIIAADFYLALLVSQRGHIFFDNTARSVYFNDPNSISTTAFRTSKVIRARLSDRMTYKKTFPAVRDTKSFFSNRAYLYIPLIQNELRDANFYAAAQETFIMITRYPIYSAKRIVRASLKLLRIF